MSVTIVRAGEVSGRMQEALSRIADYMSKEEELRSKVRRAMAYPMFLAVVGFGTIFFMVTFLVPKLKRIYDPAHRRFRSRPGCSLE